MKKDFVLEKIIARGAFGTVYKGKYENAPVAIKKIKVSNDSPSYKYLKSEIEILGRLNHDNIVKFVKFLQHKNSIFLITELVEGQDLKSFLNVQNYLDQKIAKKIFRQLIEALIYLRDIKVIHRDIKPANLVFTSTKIEETSVKLIDFGLSIFLEASLATTNVGSPLYTAPEVAQFYGCNYKADTWSLGVVFFETIYGFLPFWACTIEELLLIQKESIKYPMHPNVNEAAKELLRNMLVINPNDRMEYEDLLKLRFFSEEVDMVSTPTHEGWSDYNGLEDGPKKERLIKYLASINNIGEEKTTPEELSPVIFNYALNKTIPLKSLRELNNETSTKNEEFDQVKFEILKTFDGAKLWKLYQIVMELDEYKFTDLCSCVFKYYCKLFHDTIDIIKDILINEGLNAAMIENLDCLKTELELYYSDIEGCFMEKYGIEEKNSPNENFERQSKTITEFKKYKKKCPYPEYVQLVRESAINIYPEEKFFKKIKF